MNLCGLKAANLGDGDDLNYLKTWLNAWFKITGLETVKITKLLQCAAHRKGNF